MKKLSSTFLIMTAFLIAALFITCNKTPVAKNCFTVCDVTKNPDLRLVTNAQEVRPLLPDGETDSSSYFFTKYQVRTRPIKLVQNYIVNAYDLSYYPDWTVGDTINRVTLQCLIENIAPKDCNNDWLYNESQGYLVGTDYYFDGLFEFQICEKGNGNNWKILYTDRKKKFFPSCVAAYPYWFSNDFCYYYGIGERSIQAQMGDFYLNAFRIPNHDAVYRLILKFNPLIKGCRAVKETNYSNNDATIDLEIREGSVTILSTI